MRSLGVMGKYSSMITEVRAESDGEPHLRWNFYLPTYLIMANFAMWYRSEIVLVFSASLIKLALQRGLQ